MLQGAEPPGSRVWEIQRDEGGYTQVIRANNEHFVVEAADGTTAQRARDATDQRSPAAVALALADSSEILKLPSGCRPSTYIIGSTEIWKFSELLLWGETVHQWIRLAERRVSFTQPMGEPLSAAFSARSRKDTVAGPAERECQTPGDLFCPVLSCPVQSRPAESE
ncbi:hypothetical protein THAR02_06027 [Trichoderma harzianum]|uniref:Uncharacterized protein n=1 Tax=Trichoderma harzianum TaxID=5544 RepID=A0A0F9ZNN6_TRIHA|nr:hypothetical protein THAR02_06027 [Trichoderma harzianum]